MKRLEIKSLQGDIVYQLGQAILGGDLEDGTELTQVELARDLGVSRMPVREALFALEHQGLVTRLPNNHCRVVRPTKVQVERDLALCEVLEADVIRSLTTDSATVDLPSEERPFHLALREACGLGYPRRVLVTTVDVYVAYITAHVARASVEREATLGKVCEALRDRNADAAAEALHGYFDLLRVSSPFGKVWS